MLYGHTGLYKALTSHKGENKPEHNRNYFRHENRGETNCDDQIKVNTAKKTTKRKGHVNLNQPKQARDLKIQNSHIRRCILGNVVDCSGKPVFYLSYWSLKDRLQSWNCWSWSDINNILNLVWRRRSRHLFSHKARKTGFWNAS